MTKPFSLRELSARIVAALRSPAAEPEALCAGDIRLDLGGRTVSVGDTEVRLTRTEFAILKLLMLNPGQVVTRTLILERIAEDTPDCTESSLKIHISHLRRKLREAGSGDCTEAVWGHRFPLDEILTLSFTAFFTGVCYHRRRKGGMAMDYVLETDKLVKTYGRAKALDGLTMRVPKGAIYGFVGRNGAGKTTLIRLVAACSCRLRAAIPSTGAASRAAISPARAAGWARWSRRPASTST